MAARAAGIAGFLLFIARNIRRMAGTSLPGGRCLLLIAHPDDESMFFAPTLLNLRRNVDILCLSNGDKYGKGKIREKELRKVAEHTQARLTISLLSDGSDWNKTMVCMYIAKHYLLRPFDVLITFDEKGVSGHKNHISCYEGARLFLRAFRIQGLFLESKGILRKYCVDVSAGKISCAVPLMMYMEPVKMMLMHESQMVWYRYIYVILSNFMSYNDFREIE
ncbi:putative GlcNAc-PIde-N-acetylase [Ordospora pajunii]|uniref:putative GlcNAc-PIde-N-acetylase n=1 Tax=Ordospora pajunii TaxID=3039483 RepID=UPI0029526073|nr:putative GlcNAc-PIde-N-acetylase [Ordospora pajunii]KAH9410967.1 putative GlcNAc-PIde-N-acetylase [Ordospora pajunii]